MVFFSFSSLKNVFYFTFPATICTQHRKLPTHYLPTELSRGYHRSLSWSLYGLKYPTKLSNGGKWSSRLSKRTLLLVQVRVDDDRRSRSPSQITLNNFLYSPALVNGSQSFLFSGSFVINAYQKYDSDLIATGSHYSR